MAGPDGVADAGSITDVPVVVARSLVTGGYAEALEEFPPEAAVLSGGRERAVKARVGAKD